MPDFSTILLDWFDRHGRHDLPWQQDISPYRVWVSEVMLQQTQVNTVIPYYKRFIQRFPTIEVLARADLDEVLHLWSGLGYYSRARNLHASACIIAGDFNGIFPETIEDLQRLPGIGRSTAGAILSLSRNCPHPVLDGNVKRVLSRYHGVSGWPGERSIEKRLWELAEDHLVAHRGADYTQAIMDLGAMVCVRTRPVCGDCPVNSECFACQRSLQHEFPGKRSAKQLPVKQTCFIMIEGEEGALLLQKRPPTGLWGGLWGFPECPVEEDVVSWVKQNLGYTVNSVQYDPVIKHVFTHFRLLITPARMKLKSRTAEVREHGNIYWFKPGKTNRRLGMAAPVRRMVETRLLK